MLIVQTFNGNFFFWTVNSTKENKTYAACEAACKRMFRKAYTLGHIFIPIPSSRFYSDGHLHSEETRKKNAGKMSPLHFLLTPFFTHCSKSRKQGIIECEWSKLLYNFLMSFINFKKYVNTFYCTWFLLLWRFF